MTWRELVVSDSDGAWGPLGELVENAPANLDDATIEHGMIVYWPGMFLAAPGEDPDWDTPRGEVDWAGFEDKLRACRGF